MPGFDGTGPRGMGPMTGGGRGFCAIPLPGSWPTYAGRAAYPPYGGVPWGMPYYGPAPYAPQMAKGQELDFLKSEAQALREQLKELESRIGQLSTEE